MLALMGPSGSGKTTLLNLIAGIDRPTSGTIEVGGEDIVALSPRALARWRNRTMGFVFQQYNLVPVLSAWENVELPQAEAQVAREARRQRTAELLEYVGLSHRSHHRPSQLSGGEMQRVAVARALANRPVLLLADEPTGELDRATGEQIAQLFDRVRHDGTAVVIVTHDQAIASRAGRVLVMRDGRIERETIAP